MLGKGGFGAVYATRHSLTGQELVVKVLRANMAQDPVQLRRFLNEAKAACQLTHPNTVRVFDFGQTPDKQLYMAMERLNGQEMADVVKANAPLDPFRVIHIAIGVLKSLSEAHAAGLVHRDLKPGNIFLCDIHGEPDFVKLIDFGIAKSYEGDDPEHDLTKTGFAVGTPKYMSPEQGRAEPLDGRSDLYSLGIIIYESLTGSVPFKASSAMAMIVKHLQEAPVAVQERLAAPLPAGLNDVVMRSLAKDPWDRFSDADDMRAALEAVLEGAGRAVAERGRAVSAKFRAIPVPAADEPGGLGMPPTEATGEAATAENRSPPQPPGPAALTAQAAGAALRGQAAQQAQTLRIDTGKLVPVAATSAPAPAPTPAPALVQLDTHTRKDPPETSTQQTQSEAKQADPNAGQHSADAPGGGGDPGLHTRLVKGAAQPSLVPSTPSRPSRNRSDGIPDRSSGSGRFVMATLVILALAGGGWWFWTASKGDKPADVLEAVATDLQAKVGTTVREPLAARIGTREREKPKLKQDSALRAETDKFHAERYKGVGGKNEPLSTKEIDKALDRKDAAMIRCVHKHGIPGKAVSRISMDIKVDTKGIVTSVDVNGESGEGALGACIAAVAKTVRFRSDLPDAQSVTAYVAFPPTKAHVAATRAPAPKASAPAKRAAKPRRGSRAKPESFDGDAAL